MDNLGKVEKFLETYNLPKPNQKESESLNRPITTSETEAVIKKLLAHKTLRPDGFVGEFYQTFKGDLILLLLKLFQKNSRRGNTHKLIL